MKTRLVVSLGPTERAGLCELAASDLRDPREELRHILRQELERRGLLESDQAIKSGKAVRDGDD